MDKVWLDILPQVGATGLLAWVMYTFAKRFMDETAKQMNETIKQMSARIESAEKRLESCEADRTKLHQEFAELLLKQVHQT